jgi:hypothetical protein
MDQPSAVSSRHAPELVIFLRLALEYFSEFVVYLS